KDLPIAAMTAHALAGYRERYLAAGLNDYVSKPVELGELAAVVTRAAGARGQAVETTAADGLLDRDRALTQMGGDEKLLKVLVDIFFEELPDHLEDLTRGLERGDLEGLARITHTLKGSCGLIGASTCADLTARLETAARNGRDEEARGLIRELVRELKLFERQLQGAAAGNP
ncbi:MAG: Hpt domain-containing protein, partial [Thermodesulfobacteriota bacterium]